ncbi:unnamed protein product [Lactuca virosa]|uniref:Uncharacterized protein n=1 Tax=Lactuca virosa TaxID=75947 RepID=A0AAU9PL89_9ASTR|nr:unnamed protein product [Lactuca virosa]
MPNTPNMEAEQKNFLTNESQEEGTTNNIEGKGNEKNILEEKNDQGKGKEQEVYKRSKRTTTKTEPYQSPYMSRTVEVRKKLEAVEIRISNPYSHYKRITRKLNEAMKNYPHLKDFKKVGIFNLMISYLIDKKHPKADDLLKMEVAIFKLKWLTENNVNNSGVMLMRHMETFKGQWPNNWDSEIKKDQKQ